MAISLDHSSGSAPPGALRPVADDPDLPIDRPRSLKVRTLDDIASLLGAAAGSLAAVWILYERVFAFSGTLGFVISWYAAFLALYAGVSAMSNPTPVVVDRLMAALVAGGAAIIGVALVTTIGFVFVRGWPALSHLNFYVKDFGGIRPGAPLNQGGVIHAVVGTAIQVGIAVAIALPLGVGAAVYMSEVGGRLARTVRTVIEAMTALPDILAGLFIYVFLIVGLGWQKDGFAVSLALAVTMLPVVARSGEVVLQLVAGSLREAGLALGASQWQTVRRVVLPTARSGLATALILGIARTAGETAPLLIVSGESTFFNKNPFHDPMISLPLFVFKEVTSGVPNGIARGYGAGALLLALVLILFTVARFLTRDKQVSR
jgi:phosphate transport system permease protein